LKNLDESTDSPAIFRLDLGPNLSFSLSKHFFNGLLSRQLVPKGKLETREIRWRNLRIQVLDP